MLVEEVHIALHAAIVQDRLVFVLGVDTFSWEPKTPFMAAIEFYVLCIQDRYCDVQGILQLGVSAKN